MNGICAEYKHVSGNRECLSRGLETRALYRIIRRVKAGDAAVQDHRHAMVVIHIHQAVLGRELRRVLPWQLGHEQWE